MKRFDQRLDAAESCVPPEPSFWARLARAAPFITRPEEGTIREICRRAGIPDDMPADSNWSLIPAADIERIELIVAAAERCDHWLLELDELDDEEDEDGMGLLLRHPDFPEGRYPS